MEGNIRTVIDELVADFQSRPLPKLTRRHLVLPRLPGKADAVVGMRRSGKTWFAYQQVLDLLAEGVRRERILYMSFEDERLQPMRAADLHHVPEALYRRYPAAADGECWFFFDEIQEIAGWERFIRRLLDGGGVRILVTGSSARLLSREIATALRGRSLATEILPFSFREVLEHHGVSVPERFPPPARERALLQHHLGNYLQIGGFPEVQGMEAESRVRVLQDYVNVVLFRDVVERHAVANVAALRHLVRRLVGSPSGRLSVHRLYNDLPSQGVRVGKDSLYEYLGHLEDAFLVFTVPICSQSERARMVNPRTCYLVDPGLAGANSLRASHDTGHLLENVVYLELRRRGYEMCYVVTHSGYEVDFLARAPNRPPRLIQVCADFSNSDTRARELRALDEAMEEQRLDRAWIVTLDETETLRLGRGKVEVIPAWRWLLEPD